jgi:hypothetical protein
MIDIINKEIENNNSRTFTIYCLWGLYNLGRGYTRGDGNLYGWGFGDGNEFGVEDGNRNGNGISRIK